MYQKLIDDLENELDELGAFKGTSYAYKALKHKMKSEGYKYIGSGLDRMVFRKPRTNYVIKLSCCPNQNKTEFNAYSTCRVRWSQESMKLLAEVYAISKDGNVLAQEYVSGGLNDLVISQDFNSLVEDLLPSVTGFRDMSYTNIRYNPKTKQIKITDLGLCKEGTIRTLDCNIRFKKRKNGWIYLTNGRKVLGKCNGNLKEIKNQVWGEEASI